MFLERERGGKREGEEREREGGGERKSREKRENG